MSAYHQALLEWCRYYVETEEFDRTLTPHRDRYGNAIGFTRETQNRSDRFAREHRKKIRSDRSTAKDRAGSWTHEAQLLYLRGNQSLLGWSEAGELWPDAMVAWDALGAPFEATMLECERRYLHAVGPSCASNLPCHFDWQEDCQCLVWNESSWLPLVPPRPRYVPVPWL